MIALEGAVCYSRGRGLTVSTVKLRGLQVESKSGILRGHFPAEELATLNHQPTSHAYVEIS